ncbi:hypothetical protein PZ938_09055, partial [Luteipulveratus sp. YIM 133132]|uniref:hypothetical protein n=1 Tax=Luteipulveratus flavus TaxID=3031728 RepID=UPI0023AEAC3B
MTESSPSTPTFKAPRRPDHDPDLPSRKVMGGADGRILDPRSALSVAGVNPRSTAYVGPRLMLSTLADDSDGILTKLTEVADDLGWEIELDPGSANAPDSDGQARSQSRSVPLGVSTLSISVKDGVAAQPPDGWTLLQHARAKHGLDPFKGLGLDHVLAMSPVRSNPVH